MKNALCAGAVCALLLALGPVGLAVQQAPPATAARAAVVDLNAASLSDLEALPGVGRRTAERILEYRQKNGGFKKIEELMNVRGIGEKSFLRLKPMVAVTPRPEKAGGNQ